MDVITSIQNVGADIWPVEVLPKLFFLVLENTVDGFFKGARFSPVLDLELHHRRQ